MSDADARHCETKITVRLEDLRGIWADLSDSKRLELVKSLIWTAPNMHIFHAKVYETIGSRKFLESLD